MCTDVYIGLNRNWNRFRNRNSKLEMCTDVLLCTHWWQPMCTDVYWCVMICDGVYQCVLMCTSVCWCLIHVPMCNGSRNWNREWESETVDRNLKSKSEWKSATGTMNQNLTSESDSEIWVEIEIKDRNRNRKPECEIGFGIKSKILHWIGNRKGWI